MSLNIPHLGQAYWSHMLPSRRQDSNCLRVVITRIYCVVRKLRHRVIMTKSYGNVSANMVNRLFSIPKYDLGSWQRKIGIVLVLIKCWIFSSHWHQLHLFSVDDFHMHDGQR